MTDTETAIEIGKTVAALGPRERDVLLILARRLFMGQQRYGLLNPNDGHDWRRERAEEIQDMLIYTAIQELSDSTKTGG
jgi:hypothetical protein